MEVSKIGKLLKTIVVTGVAFILNYLINLILTPYITDTVGTAAYGFVSLAKNCAQYATVITVALNSYASRYIALEYHNQNICKSNEYFSSVFWGDIFLASVITALAFILISFLEHIFEIPESIVFDVKLLFMCVFISFWITTVFSVFSCSAYIKNKLDSTGIYKGLSYIFEAGILLVLYGFFPEKVYYVGVGLIASAFVIAISNIYICKRNTPELSASRSYFKVSAVRRLILDGIWTSANSLGNILNSGLDLVVCNLMLTPISMGEIAIVKTIDNIFHSLYQLVAQAFQPMFLKSYAQNKKEQLMSELKISMKISGILSNIAFAGFATLGMIYYELWIPNQNINLIFSLTMITIAASIVSGPMTPLYYVYTLTLKKEFPCITTIIGGILNVVGMYVLIKFTPLGIYSVVLTTTVVMLITNFITNPLYMSYALKVPYWTFYPCLIRNIISCIAITIMFKLISNIYRPNTWIGLGICGVIFCIIGAIIHLVIVCDKKELQMVFKIVSKNKKEDIEK